MKTRIPESAPGRRLLRDRLRPALLGIALVLFAGVLDVRAAGPNLNPGIIPPHAKPHGKTYGEWGAAWMEWTGKTPAAQNPILDTTGEFGHLGQEGPVWFLPGTTFFISAERTLKVPNGKALFFPLLDSLWWAPNDLPLAAAAAGFLGRDPNTMTDEELIRLLARFWNEEAALTLTIDGVAARNLELYRADSPWFHIVNTTLIEDLGVPIAQDNMAVADGYWIMLAPLPPGSHLIRISVSVDNPLFGHFEAAVTHHLLVQ